MVGIRVFFGATLVAALSSLAPPLVAEVYPLIVKGTVTMPDGSPPPFTAGIERVCSDYQGSAPGPLTNKQGEYLWRMDVDPLRTRSCFIRATHPGYTSTTVDISGLNGYTNTTATLDTLIISNRSADAYSIVSSESGVPSRASSSWKAAMKALDNQDYPETVAKIQAAVAAAPKFAVAWHALGVVEEKQLLKLPEARDAYQHAIEADPKMLPPYIALTRLCIRTKDWQCASKTADDLIKIDSKKVVTEIYLHQAVARYGLKDLAGAEASAKEALELKIPRAEYVLGRILEAKGDDAGAREHISKYLEQDKNAPDAELIRTHLQNIGKPEASQVDPELEQL